MRRSTLTLSLLLGIGCATTTQLGPSASFEETLGVYRLSSGKKALALAADEHGRKAYGVLYGSWSQDKANEKALATCTENATRSGVQALCYLFATGDRAAPETLRGCAEGRINPRRCALQDEHSVGGN
jgi:hypothetical protein